MPYSTRNTIILICIAILLLAAILIINGSRAGDLKEVKAENQDKRDRLKRLENSYPNLDNQELVLEKLHDLEKKSLANNKLIPRRNTPILTYQYLLKICRYYCPSLQFNFNILKEGKINEVPFNSYSINGRANLYSLYNLIYQIETQQLLMTIESLKLAPVTTEPQKADTVDYLIKFNAYYKNDGTKLEDIPFHVSNYDYLTYNPFVAKIHPPIKEKLDPSLVSLENSQLIGLTDNSIFLETGEGKIVELNPGDRIAYGYLQNIDTKNNRAVFVINKIGINERKILEFKKE